MKYVAFLVSGLLLFIIMIMACAQTVDTRKFEMRNALGESIGTATVMDTGEAGGVKIALDLSGLQPGTHGLHIHAVGKCEPPDYKSAGGHFNPYGKQHGRQNPEGSHVGDLPNLVVQQDGTVKVEAVAAQMPAGSKQGLFPDGAALVIHADADDEKTDPTGNAGARIACGIMVERPK